MGEKDVEKDTDSDASVKDVETAIPKFTGREGRKIYLDTGEQRVRCRNHWWQFWSVSPTVAFELDMLMIPQGAEGSPSTSSRVIRRCLCTHSNRGHLSLSLH